MTDRTSLPRTRLPYPLTRQARHLVVGTLYGCAGTLVKPLFRRQVQVEQLSTARILILKPCCLGDVVFATPLVRELRRALPSARITFGVGRHSRAAVEGNPHLDDLLDTGPVGTGAYRAIDLLSLAREIRAHQFRACFTLERSAVVGLLPLIAGIPTRIGIDSGGRGFAHNVGVSARPSRPESELYLDLFRAVGGQPRSGELEYHPSEAATSKIDRLVHERIPNRRPFVVLHCAGGTNPGMELARKRWPAERFVGLARRIQQAGAVVVLVGALDDRGIADALRQGLGETAADSGGHSGHPEDLVDLVGQLSLDELAALAGCAMVYVGNDSGPSHLAEAAGARVVTLFGPSDPIVYGPRVSRATSITAGLWCSPCFVAGRFSPCANVLCMSSISVDRVWSEIAPSLAARRST